jgi:hypothetical protein
MTGFLAQRGEDIFAVLCRNRPEVDSAPVMLAQFDYRDTGSMWGRDEIRLRSIYDGIRNDQGKQRKAAAAGKLSAEELEMDEHCQKSYDHYTQARQNGGLSVIWCPHAVCYGCHVIPSGEGRDDLFSALWTR